MEYSLGTSRKISNVEYRLFVKVAKLYYEDNLTQGEIAKKLGYSRVKIHRVLRTAREVGIVQVIINTPDSESFDVEHSIIKKYQIRDAVVVPEHPPGKDLYLALARGAISWLTPRLKPGIRVGLGVGRTISHLPQVFENPPKVDCTFTEIAGAASDHSGGFATYNITSKMAESVGGKAEFINAPTFVSNTDLKQRLTAEPSIKNILDRARKSDIILQSVGPVDNSALLYVHGFITQKELDNLKTKGAVGDALGHYYDAQGNHVPSLSDDLVISLDLSDLKNVPWSVLIAAGKEKITAIDAALKGNWFNVLITDSKSGKALLRKD
jgi:DNA-binding transcriptional regulator LsrR (DeoR family)